jgi:hypothetical protein
MPKNKSVALRVIADRIDPSTGNVTDYSLHADNVQCRINADQRSGAVIARQSSWQVRVKQDGKGSRGIRIMPLMIVAGKP